jgi:hypothetical protein
VSCLPRRAHWIERGHRRAKTLRSVSITAGTVTYPCTANPLAIRLRNPIASPPNSGCGHCHHTADSTRRSPPCQGSAATRFHPGIAYDSVSGGTVPWEKSLPPDVSGNFLDDGRKVLSQPSRGIRGGRDRAIRIEDMPQVSDVGIGHRRLNANLMKHRDVT